MVQCGYRQSGQIMSAEPAQRQQKAHRRPTSMPRCPAICLPLRHLIRAAIHEAAWSRAGGPETTTSQIHNAPAATLCRRRRPDLGPSAPAGRRQRRVQSWRASCRRGLSNAFLRIGTDNSVTADPPQAPRNGAGTYTGLATLVAEEELDAAWAQVKVEGAPADAKRYNNLFWGSAQGTGGSTAMANSWEQMPGWRRRPRDAGRRRGPALAGAGRRDRGERRCRQPRCEQAPRQLRRTGQRGRRRSGAGQRHAERPEGFSPRIGKHAHRKDSAAKTNGTAQFTQDMHLPGMLVAVVAHPPRFWRQGQIL